MLSSADTTVIPIQNPGQEIHIISYDGNVHSKAPIAQQVTCRTLSEGNIQLASSLSLETQFERNYENVPHHNLMQKYAEPYVNTFLLLFWA